MRPRFQRQPTRVWISRPISARTSHAVIQNLRHGHSREHAVHKQLRPLLVELISDLGELRDLVRLTLLQNRRAGWGLSWHSPLRVATVTNTPDSCSLFFSGTIHLR
jgi:hypothetical protein